VDVEVLRGCTVLEGRSTALGNNRRRAAPVMLSRWKKKAAVGLVPLASRRPAARGVLLLGGGPQRTRRGGWGSLRWWSSTVAALVGRLAERTSGNGAEQRASVRKRKWKRVLLCCVHAKIRKRPHEAVTNTVRNDNHGAPDMKAGKRSEGARSKRALTGEPAQFGDFPNLKK
jgi:hypothetical protein